MAGPPDDRLGYEPPRRVNKAAAVAALVLAILFACFVGLLVLAGIGLMTGTRQMIAIVAVISLVCAGAILAYFLRRPKAFYPAAAIVAIASAAFVLMLGLCATS
jgi:hypothetical protein